jgi:exonuclease SbcC
LTSERQAAETELQRLAAERESITQKRITLGFDPADLARAEAAERTAAQEERAALDARTGAQTALNDATGIRDRLVKESERVARLADRADTRAREADDFDRMYREFTVFDQFVAGRITPLLADQTSELLREVTDGKYDRVDFDDNYGLELYDGITEKFPIEEFSGGERDVAALCARLALSRLVGGQSSHPPGFLVLDEVFGSLDQERRAQVLTTLGALAGTAEAFRQLFIISHVDDVRASPIFSEIWRLTETADGVSAIEVQSQSALEEL